MTHLSDSDFVIVGSSNGLSQDRRQAQATGSTSDDSYNVH